MINIEYLAVTYRNDEIEELLMSDFRTLYKRINSEIKNDFYDKAELYVADDLFSKEIFVTFYKDSANNVKMVRHCDKRCAIIR